jgi:magnesium/cobalt transport protein CorA
MAQVVWVDVLDPSSADLGKVLPAGVHRLALQRLEATPRHDDDPRPRLETSTVKDLVLQEVSFIASRDTFLTVRKTPSGAGPYECGDLVAVANREHRPSGMCLYMLFDDIAERFLAVVDACDADIDELEDHVEEWEASRIRERIGGLRHDILHVRRILAPTRDAARAVLDNRIELESEPELFPHDVELHFADAYDKLLRATDGLDLSRDLLAGVRDYHQAQVANNQNEVMKRLTVIASVLLLPAFIVGLYGMNVKGIPEYGWANGYLWAWALIIVTTIGQIVYFRRKKWV